jgi:outer membrane protein assembly factor BamB
MVFVSASVKCYCHNFGRGTETLAYGAATGAQLWTARHADTSRQSSVSVTPDGSTVLVGSGDSVIAYESPTGATRWSQVWVRSSGAIGGDVSMVGASGGDVYVTGEAGRMGCGGDPSALVDTYLTSAYDASTGARLWRSRYRGSLCTPYESGDALTVGPDGSSVFVTGHMLTSDQTGNQASYGTVAYDGATGTQLWASRFADAAAPNNTPEGQPSIAVSQDGSRVYLAGTAQVTSSTVAFATLAYSASAGTTIWKSEYPSGDQANAVAVGGGKVFITGQSPAPGPCCPDQYATVAYTG